MKIIVTHKSCDLDGIASIWLLKRFLPGWSNTELAFVPAGSKLEGSYEAEGEVIERVDGNEVIHVDTGLGLLDHHQTQDTNTSATSLTFDYIKKAHAKDTSLLESSKFKAVARIVKYAVDTDHFKEFFWPDPASDIHEFSLIGLLEGFRYEFPEDDIKNAELGTSCLDGLLHTFENKIWAEESIAEKGQEFQTRYGKCLAIETHNDTVLKLGQKMGYVIVVRKDPTTGSIRIKTMPNNPYDSTATQNHINLTSIYEKLKVKDPTANWFLHISKKMLLNGSSKNPQMKGSVLTLFEVVDVITQEYK